MHYSFFQKAAFFLLFFLISSTCGSTENTKRSPFKIKKCEETLLPDQSKVLLSPNDWNAYLGEVWHHLLSSYSVPQNGIVVEIAPGNVEKIGLGFQNYGFTGTLYIVEPHGESLKIIVGKYKKLLPQAHIIPIQKTLKEAVSELPTEVDAVVANHPLDDMIAGKSLDQDEFTNFFAKMYEKSDEDLTKKIWEQLRRSPDTAKSIILGVVQEWNELIAHTTPSLLVISQYPGLYHAQHGVNAADDYAVQALQTLQKTWPNSSSKSKKVLAHVGQDFSRWFIYEAKRNFSRDMSLHPHALERLANEAFVTTNAAKIGSDELELVYVNKELLAELGYNSLLEKKTGLVSTLTEAFGLDLSSSQTNSTTKVWVDRQSDPLQIAMNGNLGSGRAVYVGNKFNAKGIGRTPLVQEPEDSVHGNGRLAFSSSLWETVVSNSLYSNLRTGTSPTLAVFKYKNRNVAAPWNGEHSQTKAGLLVRIDDGSLTRPVHLFQNLHLGKTIDLKKLAVRFAEQDAEKFIERIVHGAWSSGNISLQGHLIDMDTVSAVAGRSPQYSLTGKYIPNLFGLEGHGQIRILKALASNQEINLQKISHPELEETFLRSRKKHLQRRILDLFGIAPMYNAKVRQALGEKLEELSTTFENLSTKMFPDFSSLETWNKNSKSKHVFNFSSLFRHYPVLRKTTSDRSVRKALAMNYLRASKPRFHFIDSPRVSEDVRQILESEFVVHSEEELNLLETEARRFLDNFDSFFDELKNLSLLGDQNLVIARAYKTNEDRHYLTDSFGASFVYNLAEENELGRLSSEEIGRFINLLIQANDRTPGQSESRTDFRIFKEGYLYRSLVATKKKRLQQKIKIHLFEKLKMPSSSRWTLKIDGQPFPLKVARHNSDLVLTTDLLDEFLLKKATITLQLLVNETSFSFTDYSESGPRSDFTFEVIP